jgi:hypothetical protein
VIAFLAGVVGLFLNQPRLAPIALFLGVLLTILAAIAWNTPKLPLLGETRPIGAPADGTGDAVAPNAGTDDTSSSQQLPSVALREDDA